MIVGELFSGPGGMALGASRAGFRHGWAIDIDPDTCATYRYNIDGASPESVICADVNDVELEELPKIDCLAFGFPCNDFSLVGEQKGLRGAFGPLYRHGVRVLRSHQPKVFVAENVGGIRSANDGTAFGLILSELVNSGYVVKAHLYSSELYGVPQKRKRVMIVGLRSDLLRSFEVPAPTTEQSPVSAARALANIPAWAKNQEATRQSEMVVERLKHILPGNNAFNSDLPEHLQIKTKTQISQIYRRLHPDQPAYTVTGSGGGGTHIYHWSEHRALTNRERARLQTFPDEYEFMGSKESVRKQIGMAVPPLLAEAVFKAVASTLRGEAYPSIPPSIDAELQLHLL